MQPVPASVIGKPPAVHGVIAIGQIALVLQRAVVARQNAPIR